MFKSASKGIMGSRHKREAKKLQPLIAEINTIFEGLSSLTDDQRREKTQEFRDRVSAATAELDVEILELREKERHSEDPLERERLGQEIGGPGASTASSGAGPAVRATRARRSSS